MIRLNLIYLLYTLGEVASKGCFHLFHIVTIDFLLDERHFLLATNTLLVGLELSQVLPLETMHLLLDQIFLFVSVDEVIHIVFLRLNFLC